MTTLFLLSPPKRYSMINKVTFRVIARGQGAGTDVSLCAQLFVNKARVVIPLSIYIEDKYFDSAKEIVKINHPECGHYNSIINNARSRAMEILSQANEKNTRLDRETFRARFTTTNSDIDFVKFWQQELESRKGAIEKSTWIQQNASLKKFVEFRSSVPFDMLTTGLIDDYEKFLRKKGNNVNTISAAMKNFKGYINAAIRKGVEIKNPFAHYKIRVGQGRIVFLTIEEQHKLIEMYNKHELQEHLQESLLVYLVQSFTSLRISDARTLSDNWISQGVLEFMPYKTRRYQKYVRFGLSKIALRFIKDFMMLKARKKLKSDQKINDDLKLIAAHGRINKTITTHVARHTFATTYLTIGGSVEVLKDIMGHSRIETTMRYVHVIDTRKTEQMGNFDNEFK